MKVIFPLLALTFFLFLAYLTHPGKGDETPQFVEKQDFFFKDFIHGTTITGSWIDEDCTVKMEINSIRLDVKLVFEFTEITGSANINSRSPGDDNRTPKHGKILKFKECPKYSRNATCQDFETFRPRTPGLMARVWDISWTMMTGTWKKSYDSTVTMATRGWNGVTGLAEWSWDKVTWLADGVWNGVTMLADWIWNGVAWLSEWIWNRVAWLADEVWNGVTWLADRAWNGVAWLAEEVWNGVTWLAEWIWNEVTRLAVGVWNGLTWLADGAWKGVTWLAEWTWNGVGWLAEWIWNGLTWTGRLFLPVTDCVVNFYYGYLHSHVNHIGTQISASTWQDVFYVMSAVFVVNAAVLVTYLFITCTVNFIRRLWQARKDRITAAKTPPAPKKPIWRPKPKKKRRKNKNGW